MLADLCNPNNPNYDPVVAAQRKRDKENNVNVSSGALVVKSNMGMSMPMAMSKTT